MAGIALEGGTVRLAVGEYDFGDEPNGALLLQTKGLLLLGEEGEGVVITRAVDTGSRCRRMPRA